MISMQKKWWEGEKWGPMRVIKIETIHDDDDDDDDKDYKNDSIRN